MYDKTIGENFQQLKDKHSLGKLAIVSGITTVSMRKWCDGEIPFALIALRNLHRILDIDLNKLLGDFNENDSDRSVDQ